MDIQVEGFNAYVYDGGRAYDASKPSVVFVHGASLDHTVWTLPARYFARHGLNVLAVDLPGHGRSKGNPLPSIEEYAAWVVRVLDVLEVSEAALVGHSMGSLVVLDCAARYPEKVRSLALVGTAVPMPVTDDLLNFSKANNHEAIDMLTAWGHSPNAHFGGNETPGLWMIGGLMRLFERGGPGVLHNDLVACNNYKHGMEAGKQVQCPTMLILGANDMLTPARVARELASAIKNSETVILPATGHTIMSEKPDDLLDALIRIVSN